MARNRLRQSEEKTDINISPMIDMVFILLIFFIVTTVFVDEQGINITKPTPSNAPNQNDQDNEPVIFLVNERSQVFFGERSVTYDDIGTIVENELGRRDVPVIVQVKRGAIAGVLIRVMDSAYAAKPEAKVNVVSVD